MSDDFELFPLLRACPPLAGYAEEIVRSGVVDPALMTCLTAEAERYLRAGGVWSSREWRAMSDLEQVAAEAAGDRLWRVRTALVLEALGATEGAASVLAPVDGGQSVELVALDRVLAAVIAKQGVQP